jgi:hypothetical protein
MDRITNPRISKSDLLYPELSYQIVGILFNVSNQLGYGHRESTSQSVIGELLREEGVKFDEQHPCDLVARGKITRKYKMILLSIIVLY